MLRMLCPHAAHAVPPGLLLASIRDPNPVVFFEAKMLYRTAVEDVPQAGGTAGLYFSLVLQTGTAGYGRGAELTVLPST